MTGRDPIAKETRDEAARWYARLNNTTVTTDCLREFRAWKEIGDNREAYADIDAFWRRAEQLKGDPDIAKAGEEALERKAKPPFSGPGGKGALGVLLAVSLGAALAYGYRAYTGTPYSTAVGEQHLVRLDDGSRVRLDTDSKLRVRLSKDERRIELIRGQAFFEVAHDPTRPFIVHAANASIRALGTRFDVRRSADDVQVILVEGQVEVATQLVGGPTSWTLTPDQQITLGKGSASHRRLVDAAAATSWTSGRLVFQNQPLQAAIDEVNRYSRTRIVLTDAKVGRTPVSGSFESGDTEAFVAAVKSLHNLTIEQRTAREIRLAPAA